MGLVSVLITQARADNRQERIATSALEFQRETALLNTRRKAGSDLIAAVWALARHSRDVLPDKSDASDLHAAERAEVDQAYSQMVMVCDRKQREAADALIDAMHAWIKAFDDETWGALGLAEDRLIEAVNTDLS